MDDAQFGGQFMHYVVPPSEVVALAFSSGLIVLDANVLLDLYKFAADSRTELLSVIERFRDRIWIPHQVGEEFYRNRIKVMADIHAGYSVLLGHLRKMQPKIIDEISGRINQLDNQVLLRGEKAGLLRLLDSVLSPMMEAVEALAAKHKLGGSYADDPILKKLETLLHGRIGQPFTEDLEAYLKEAERRIEANEPPGYKDSDKNSAHGDYFAWAQTLNHAKSVKCAALLFVTSDKKEDWYREINGQLVSARPELALEARTMAGCHLVMMSAADFLRQSQEYAHVDVSDETIREAEDLTRQRGARKRIDQLRAELSMVAARRDDLRLEMDRRAEVLAATRHEHQKLSHQLTELREYQEGSGGEQTDLLERQRDLQQLQAKADSMLHMLRRDSESLHAQYAESQAALASAESELEALASRESEQARAESRLRTLLSQVAEAEAHLAALESQNPD